MTESDPWLQAVCALLVLGLPCLSIAQVLPVPRTVWVAGGCAGLVAAIAVIAVAAGLGLRNDAPAALLDAALAASVTAVVVLVTAHRRGPLHAAVRSALWGALALAPILILSVSAVPSLLQRSLGALDAGGVVVTHAAPAAAVLVAALMPSGRLARGTDASPLDSPPALRPAEARRSARVRTGIAVTLLATASAAWMVGVERVVSEATGRLAVNAAVGVLLGAVVWVYIARIVGRPARAGSALLGGALGWAAIGAGGAFLAPPALVAAAVIGPAAGAALVLRRPSDTEPLLRSAVAVVLASAAGGVIVGLLADGLGLAATGSLLGVPAQLLVILLAIVLSAAIAALAWTGSTLVTWLVRRQSWWAIPDSN